jgi:hypothetical protein
MQELTFEKRVKMNRRNEVKKAVEGFNQRIR